METSGNFLAEKRTSKKISIAKAARDLKIKKEHLQAIEEGNWQILPEPTFVKGFIKSYAKYLGLDSAHTLALYRREFDEAKYPQKESPIKKDRRFMLTPNKVITTVFVVCVIAFIIYLTAQYFSILKSPNLEIASPENDLTTSIPYVVVSGKVESDSTVSIEGEFVAVDSAGNFTKQVELTEGKNTIEIIAAKRLSPKTKITKTVRLTR